MDHDCAIITAFRANPFDRSKCVDQTPLRYSSQDHSASSVNKLNNRDLKAALLSSGCGVAAVDGSFIETIRTSMAVEVTEDSVFVANLADDPNFFQLINKLGKRFCQDSVLLISHGGRDVYLYGTNNSEFPGLDQQVKVGEWEGGKEGEVTARIGSRPFTLQTYQGMSRLERMAAQAITNGLKLD